MTREIVLDTETTGLSPLEGHRVVEIGAVELINHIPTGRSFHTYLNPQRDMPKEAEAVHGLSATFLRDKPVFQAVAEEFLVFIADSLLVIHNASFDIGFLNAEMMRINLPALDMGRVVDTLQLAKKRHPMAPNSLDALCKRYGVDLSRRSKHGALLDSELLAEVYLELIGGRQVTLGLGQSAAPQRLRPGPAPDRISSFGTQRQRPAPLAPRLSAEERAAHERMLGELGETAVWLKG
jgi:DNA polymerase-3 subunit epsilon